MKYKVIVIDDDIDTAQKIKSFEFWENTNFEPVECFSNAEEAIDYLYDNHIDLAICDIHMPDFSGMELAKYCKAHFKSVGVILIDEYSDFKSVQRAMRYGVKDYLLKPVTSKALEDAITRLHDNLSEAEQSQLNENSEPFKLQSVFTDIIHGEITDTDTLSSLCRTIGISPRLMKNECSVFMIKINNLDDYLNTKWKYGHERFYNAISYVSNQNTSSYCVCSIRKSYSEYECLCTSKSSNANGFDKCINTIRDTLMSMFKLEVEYELVATFPTLGDLVLGRERLSSDKTKAESNADIIERIYKYLEMNYQNSELNRDTVAQEVFLNSTYFSAIFKKKSGKSFVEVLNNIRIEKSKSYVTDKSIKISSIHKYVGYKDSKYFMKMFKKITGMTPTEYRNTMAKQN